MVEDNGKTEMFIFQNREGGRLKTIDIDEGFRDTCRRFKTKR